MRRSRLSIFTVAMASLLITALGCNNSWKNHPTQEPSGMKTMKLGYMLFYVSDVEQTLEFYESAFGIERKFCQVDGDKGYGELATGATTLGFISYAQAKSTGMIFLEPQTTGPAQAVEIGFITNDVAQAYKLAIERGAIAVAPPEEKPWGQTVSYVRDIKKMKRGKASPTASPQPVVTASLSKTIPPHENSNGPKRPSIRSVFGGATPLVFRESICLRASLLCLGSSAGPVSC